MSVYIFLLLDKRRKEYKTTYDILVLMKDIILLHDAFAKPTQYWYAKLASIAPEGYSVVTPELPGDAEQGMEYWMKNLEQYTHEIDQETIIISHGISSLLAMRLSETLTRPIRMFISIAGCAEAPQHQALAPVAETFLQKPFDWKLIARTMNSVVHIWNKSDPFVSPDVSKHFAELLPGKTITLNGAEHFTELDEPDLFNQLRTLFQEIEKADGEKVLLQKNQAEQQKKIDLAQSSIPSIVTYDTDVAQSVAGYQGKVISEMLENARTEEQEKKQVSIKNPKNILYILGSIVLVLLAIGILGYVITSKLSTVTQVMQSADTKYESPLLRVEQISPLELSGSENFKLREKLKELQATEVPERAFSAIVPTLGGKRASLQDFIDAFGMKFPVGFSGKTNDFVYGYYHPDQEDSRAFLLISFEGYDVMYSVMRNWEKDMAGGLQPLFFPDQETTTLLKTETPAFSDVIINNIPMRVATLASGETIAYGFLTDQTLLIARSTAVAEPLLRRMIGR